MILDKHAKFYRFCGQIIDKPSLEIIKRYKIPTHLSPYEAYNSKQMYLFRKDMLLGKCLDVCSSCRTGSSFYEEMKSKKITEEKRNNFWENFKNLKQYIGLKKREL